MSTRVYLPTTWQGLTSLVSGTGWPEVRAALGAEPVVAEGDAEDEEYAALMTAADASTALALDAAEGGEGAGGLSGGVRRVVLVAELPSPDAEITLSDVVAVHLDTDDRGPEADPDDDLAWFAPEELATLL